MVDPGTVAPKRVRAVSAFEPAVLRQAALDALRKLAPQIMVRNPVMFVVEVGAVLTTLVWIKDLLTTQAGAAPAWFTGNVSAWLWFTVLFANFAEALAEARQGPGRRHARPAPGHDGPPRARRSHGDRAGLRAAQGG